MAAEKIGSKVAVVVVPFPAQGHLTPLLRLSRTVSSYNIPVYFVAADIHIRQATARAHGWEDDHSAAANLHLHAFPTPQFENLLPDPNAAYKYPHHQGPMVRAILPNFREPLHNLVNKLAAEEDHNRVVIVFDSLMSLLVKSVHDSVSSPKVESYCYESISAFTLHASHWEAAGKPNLPAEAAEVLKELPSTAGCLNPEFSDFIKFQYMCRTFHSGTIYNTSRSIEGLYLDLLSKLINHGADKRWAVGPLNRVFSEEKPDSNSVCLEWLDKQPKDSVMFVSFGTTSTLSDEQMTELAVGLERSGHRFIWALRDADRGDIFEGGDRRRELPQGYEERVKERGIVVRDWVPQLEILEHSATGGFMTHCGWNSLMESMTMGVPIAAWPMHADQPRNALLMTKVVKIGVDVRDWERRDEVVRSSLVEEAVKRVMGSPEMRERAEKLKVSIRGGVAATKEMDSFIAHISR